MDTHWKTRIPAKALEKPIVKKFIEDILAEKWVYHIFGSATSRDYDIMVIYSHEIFEKYILNKIPPHMFHFLAKIYENFLSESLSDKPLNVNFASVDKDGYIHWAFKGSPDECNNSIYLTYDKHIQTNDLVISGLVERNIGYKIIRGTRDILAAVSRSEFREKVKTGIRSDIDLKTRFDIMKEIFPHWKSLTYYKDSIPEKPKRKLLNIRKSFKGVAFQAGQILGLIEGIEYYDKVDVAKTYPPLTPFLLMKTISEDAVSDDFTIPFEMFSEDVNSGTLDSPFFSPEDLEGLQEFLISFFDKLITYCDEHPEIYKLKEVLQGKI